MHSERGCQRYGRLGDTLTEWREQGGVQVSVAGRGQQSKAGGREALEPTTEEISHHLCGQRNVASQPTAVGASMRSVRAQKSGIKAGRRQTRSLWLRHQTSTQMGGLP